MGSDGCRFSKGVGSYIVKHKRCCCAMHFAHKF